MPFQSNYRVAEEALESSSRYRSSKGEAMVNNVGNRVTNLMDSPVATASRSENGNAMFALVNDEISHFAENTRILVNILDDVAKVHPFIQAAVIVFKAGLQMELTRRENDSKVIALHIVMCDMMQELCLLQQLDNGKVKARDTEGFTIEKRLSDRMDDIVESVTQCARLCDSYQRRRVAIKFLSSWKWQAKFEEAATVFDDHKKGIQSDLQLHVSIEVIKANQTLDSIKKDVSLMMQVVFERMKNAEEREMSNFVETKGGKDVVLQNEKLMMQVVERQRKEKQQLSATKSDPVINSYSSFKKEVEEEIEDILGQNNRLFEERFGAIAMSLRDVKETVRHEGDRVVDEILANINAGPQERICDKDLYHVWKEMGWKGSVKATHLVLALHDHFSQKASSIGTHNGARRDNLSSSINQALTIPADEVWSLEYITIRRIQPLVEALDEDGSSFVTVNELNEFTTARPDGWSLPRWIAYWSYGFEMTCQWYYLRIWATLSSLVNASKYVRPANRSAVSKFLMSDPMIWVEQLLSGIRDVDGWKRASHWENSFIFLKFKEYIGANEKRLKTLLRKISYWVDQDNTLMTVTGGSRPEEYTLPVLHLLLQRALWISERGEHEILHPDELRIIELSIGNLKVAVCDRALKLQAFYSIHNTNPEEKLKKVFFGLWTYVLHPPEKDVQFSREFDDYTGFSDSTDDDLDIPEPPLFYGGQTLDTLGIDIAEQVPIDNSSLLGDTETLVGEWNGNFSYLYSETYDGLVGMRITTHNADNSFEGSGTDLYGAFSISGSIVGSNIQFLKSYAALQEGMKVEWHYRGKLDKDRREIVGHWGSVKRQHECDSEEESEPSDEDVDTHIGNDEFFAYGAFVMSHRPVEFFLCRPPEKAFVENRANALWQFVRNVARFRYQRRHLTPSSLAERREKRQAWEEIFKRRDLYGNFQDSSDEAKIEEVTRYVHPDDLHWWRALFMHKQLHETNHDLITCDNCGLQPSTRFCCIVCSRGEFLDTYDLCSGCHSKTVFRPVRAHHHHRSHSLLQLRRALPRTELGPLIFKAPRTINYVKSYSASCQSCDSLITSRPFWYCLECRGETFICLACNVRHETVRPWTFHQEEEDSDVHDTMHTLLLVTAPEKIPEQDNELSPEQRLELIESKMLGQAEDLRLFKVSVSQRLENLESLLERVVQAVTMNTGSTPS